MKPILSVVLTGLCLAACSQSAADPTDFLGPTPEPTIGKYEQTWKKPYENTRCGDWRRRMDDHQRFVMAGDMLLTLWQNEGADAFPEDSVITAFAQGISNACKGAGVTLKLKVPEVAVLLYNIADDIQPPP